MHKLGSHCYRKLGAASCGSTVGLKYLDWLSQINHRKTQPMASITHTQFSSTFYFGI